MKQQIQFIKEKLALAERDLKARTSMPKTWAGGTTESWQAVGCNLNKAQRDIASQRHARIEVKLLREVELFKAVLATLETIAS